MSYRIPAFLLTLLWTGVVAQSPVSEQCRMLRIEQAHALPGERVCLQVSGENIGAFLALQTSIKWDTSVLRFAEVNDFNLRGLDNNAFGLSPNLLNRGILTMAYFDAAFAGQVVDAPMPFFSICFDVVGEMGRSSPVYFDSDPTDTEIVTSSFSQVAALSLVGGRVAVQETPLIPPQIRSICTRIEDCRLPTQGRITVQMDQENADFHYRWSGPNNFQSASTTIQEIGLGNYRLHIQDPSGEKTEALVLLQTEASFSIKAIATPPDCGAANGNINLTVNGGSGHFFFDWSNGEEQADLTDLEAGNYSITVFDTELQCPQSRSFDLDPALTFSIDSILVDHVSCNDTQNGTIEIFTSSEQPLTFSWDNGADGAAIDSLSPGTYTCTITGSDGCTTVRTATVEQGQPPAFSLQTRLANCDGSGGQIRVRPLSSDQQFAVEWGDGAAGGLRNDLGPGSHALTITDRTTGCQVDTSVTLRARAIIADLISTCRVENGEMRSFVEATVYGTPPQPLQLQWSDGETQTLDGFAPQRTGRLAVPRQLYRLTVTDGGGCVAETFVAAADCAQLTPDTIRLSTPEVRVVPGESFCVPIEVSPFTNITALTFTLNWPSESLQLDGWLPHPDLPGQWDIPYNAEGTAEDDEFHFSWQAPNSAPAGSALPNGTPLIQLCFSPKPGSSGQSTPLTVTGESVRVGTDAAAVVVVPEIPPIKVVDVEERPFTFRADRLTAIAGDTVCVPLRVLGLKNVAGIQGSVRFDDQLLELAEVRKVDPLLGFFDDNNFGTPTKTPDALTFAALHSDPGASLPDSTILFEVCYLVKNSIGVSLVSTSNTPTAIEAIKLTNQGFDVLADVRTHPGAVRVFANEVWPGDTDGNGTVNLRDYLTLGLGIGSSGPVRPRASNDWTGQRAPLWNQQLPQTRANYRYLDADGNGRIELADTLAIHNNFGATVPLPQPAVPAGFDLPQQLGAERVDLRVTLDTLFWGQKVRVPVILADSTNPVQNFHGLLFMARIHPGERIDPESLRFTPASGWLGPADSLITISKRGAKTPSLYTALSRIDGRGCNGSGLVGYIHFRLLEAPPVTDSITILELIIDEPFLLDANNRTIPVRSLGDKAPVLMITGTQTKDSALDGRVYPNPSTNILYLDLPENIDYTITLYDINSRPVLQVAGDQRQLDLSRLPAGAYLLHLTSPEGSFRQWIQRIKTP